LLSKEVSKIFNDFFINVAKDIGDKSIQINKEHPSVMKISENNTINNELIFKHVSEESEEIPLIGHEWHAQRS
jgi:hypothetical protein